MKIHIVLIFFAACTIACQKGGSVSPTLFGKWELRREYGGLYYRDTAYKLGNGTYYQFNSDSTYKHYTKNNLDGQGVFHIRMFHDDSANHLPNHEIFFDNTTYGQLFVMNGTMITIGTTATDQIALDFQKISD